MPNVARPKVFVSPVPDFFGRQGDDGDYVNSVLVVLDVNQGRALHNEYRIDNGEWTHYRAPFAITKKGVHAVIFRTLDDNGNMLAEVARMVVVEHGRKHDDKHCSR